MYSAPSAVFKREFFAVSILVETLQDTADSQQKTTVLHINSICSALYIGENVLLCAVKCLIRFLFKSDKVGKALNRSRCGKSSQMNRNKTQSLERFWNMQSDKNLIKTLRFRWGLEKMWNCGMRNMSEPCISLSLVCCIACWSICFNDLLQRVSLIDNLLHKVMLCVTYWRWKSR